MLVLVAAVLVVMMGESHGIDRSTPIDRPFVFPRSGCRRRAAVRGLGLGIVEGVLPLHLSSELSQSDIGLLYAAMSVVVAVASALAARLRPRQALGAALALIVVGIAVAGADDQVPCGPLALAVAGVGIGLANTGSIGVLLEGVPTERIVTAMVVWSQLGIVGYFIGPLAGGFVAQSAGYAAIGLVPLSRDHPRTRPGGSDAKVMRPPPHTAPRCVPSRAIGRHAGLSVRHHGITIALHRLGPREGSSSGITSA